MLVFFKDTKLAFCIIGCYIIRKQIYYPLANNNLLTQVILISLRRDFMNQDNYKYYTIHRAAPSPILKDCLFAFLFGGTICTFAELLYNFYSGFIKADTTSRLMVSVTLIFLTCLLSGLGIFPKIAKIAGAGTLVPITGFANAVVSPAIDYKAEGLVLGLAAKMFIIAGPVIVYGTVASVIYGVIYWVANLN